MRITSLYTKIVKTIFLVLSFSFLSNESYSANATLDSMKLLIPTVTDSNKVILQNDIAYIYFYINTDSTQKYALQALKNAERIQYKKGISEAKRLIGISYRDKNEHKKAIDWLQQALILAEEIHYDQGIGDILNSIGVSFSKIKDWDQALDYYFKSLYYQKNAKNTFREGLLYANIGECLINKNLIDSAYYFLKKSESIFEHTDNPKWLSLLYAEMGRMYIARDNLSEAYKYSKNAYELANRIQHQRQIHKSLYNLSTIYLKRKMYKTAETYGHQCLEAAEKTKHTPYIVDAYDLLFRIYQAQSDYKNALLCHIKLSRYSDSLRLQNDYSEKNLLNFQLDLEKAEKENLILRNESEKQERNIQRRNILVLTIFICLILVSFIAYFFYRLRKKESHVNTELKKSNSELAEQREKLRATLQMVEILNAHLQAQNNTINQIAIVSIADLEGNIISVNDNFCNLTGYTRSELLLNKHNILKTNSLDKKLYESLWKDISNGKTWRGELKNMNKNGDIFWTDTAIAPILDDDNKPNQFFALQFEISERKKYESQLSNKSRELTDLNKLKDKLLSVVSHDFRSPLHSLRGALALFLKGALSNEEMKILAENIVEKLDNTYSLLENLLSWAKSQMQGLKVYKKEIDLKIITQDCIQLLGPIADRKMIRIINKINKPVIAFADNEMIKLVIRNLISNAIKFTDAGGEIKIEAKKYDNDIIISIHDTGLGISNEKQEKIFNMENVTTEGTDHETGIGLGLLLCKDFVERNDGNLWFESELGKGSIFYFNLPVKILQSVE